MKKFILIVGLSLIFKTYLFGLGYLHCSGTTIVDGTNNEVILHGVGIGGWMVQEGYMYGNSGSFYTQHALKAKLATLIGNTETEKFYTNWRNNFMQQSDVDSIAKWGFNSIRVPLHYNLFSRCFAADPQEDEGFRLIDNLLTWAAAKNIYVILDMHATPGGQGDDTGISDRDATKPYLWTSTANQDTLVQIWKNIAKKYATHPLIGGYDLINEPNYAPMKPNNQPLRDLFVRITNAIRLWDTNHIIFIEGNDYANNFTGLTPPWDNNMAYSFHKYWNSNSKNAIQSFLTLRSSTNRPLWVGETGENSNAWFTDCVKLLEENKIGYSNWSYKPYNRIQCPVTIKAFANWQKVLNYVNNNVGLTPSECIAYLKEMTDGLLLENCRINKDVIDAWTRQPFDYASKAYALNNIPGIIHAVNYDLGTQGVAYSDNIFQKTTQTNVVWNTGKLFRNDGVDIGACNDVAPYNIGFNVSWIEDNEWLSYTIDITSSGVYNLSLRCSNGGSTTGYLHVEIDGKDVSGFASITPTGGWQNWRDFVVKGVMLPLGKHKMKIFFDKAAYNLNAVNWSQSNEPIVMRPMSANAIDDTTIRLTFNKPLNTTNTLTTSDFKINSSVNHLVDKVVYDSKDVYSLLINSKSIIFYNELLSISYSGIMLKSGENEMAPTISNLFVSNKIPTRYELPAKIEAENYSESAGIQTETCTDTGGGLDVGNTNAGDYMKYLVYVPTTGIYELVFRMAGNGGKASLYYDDPTNTSLIGTVNFASTGGWQTWQDFKISMPLQAGAHTLKFLVDALGFNLNYISFQSSLSAVQSPIIDADFYCYFDTMKNNFTVVYNSICTSAKIEILDLQGRIFFSSKFNAAQHTNNKFSVGKLKKGIYIARLSDGIKTLSHKVVMI